ncbi:MAG: bifunctional 3-deoxy-7-phosphoheptulonate synthase/chorismate mutase type II [Bacteroidota bacterium]
MNKDKAMLSFCIFASDFYMSVFTSLTNWDLGFQTRPFLISGPCGAETHEQVLKTAIQLKSKGVHLFRAGIWKPRTRPGSFEGMGEEALKWLQEVKQETGIPVTVEVASPTHIELALKYNVDVLWLGARTTVNPFLVQELASSLKGVNIPVMIKNPVNPDLALWIGAIERISKAGIEKIAAIHRGFSSYENSTYRNKPNWEIPIELRRLLPGIPLICDPSHICGNTFMQQYVAQFALDMQYDGLMIESHYKPAEALSDAKQQFTPDELGDLISSLVVRNATTDDETALSKIEDMRDQIDELDDQIVTLLAERMRVARLIGEYKFHHHIAILQPERWEEIIRTRTINGVDKKLTEEFILTLYTMIHKESIYQQTQQMEAEKKSDTLQQEPNS